MLFQRKNGATSNTFRVTLRNSTTGQGLTGLAYNSSGLIISTICDNEASATAYTAAGSTIETVSTLGTFSAPTATKCRFKEVDATNHPGLYEIQLADARFAVSAARILKLSITGATNLLGKEVTIQLLSVDVDDATRFGLTALPNASAGANGGLPTVDANNAVKVQSGTGANQISLSSGIIADPAGVTTLLTRIVGTLLTGNHSPQSGDAYSRIGAAGAGLTALGDTRLAYLDGSIASVLTAISNLNNLSALANLYGSPLLEIPDSSTMAFAFTLIVRDNEGKLVDLDASPTIAAANAAGTDRSAKLSAVSHPATGRYTFTYTVSSTDSEESLRITCSGAVSAEGRYIEWIGAVVNYDTLTQINAIKAKTDNLPASPASTGDVTSARDSVLTILGTPAGASMSADIAAVKTDTGSLVTRITSTLFSGITSLAQWLGLMAGKQAGNSTALTEMRATGAGSGTFDPTTDSLEKLGEAEAAPSAATIAGAVWDEALAGHATAGSAGAALSSASAPSAAAVADAVWDEALSGHATAGTAGAALSAAQSAGDPWATAVPGAYAAGTAGAKLGALPQDISVTIPAAVATASQTPGLIIAVRSSRLSDDLPVMGAITGYTKLDWMVKRRLSDADSEALIHVRVGTGLLRLNGAAATDAALASLTVSNADTGASTLVLEAGLTAQLALLGELYWACKVWDSSGYPSEPISGRFSVSAGVVQATT